MAVGVNAGRVSFKLVFTRDTTTNGVRCSVDRLQTTVLPCPRLHCICRHPWVRKCRHGRATCAGDVLDGVSLMTFGFIRSGELVIPVFIGVGLLKCSGAELKSN